MFSSGLIGAYYYVAPSLPPADAIREIPLQIPLRIFSRDGRLIEEVLQPKTAVSSNTPASIISAYCVPACE
jgi:penicillin-binding protein 1A